MAEKQSPQDQTADLKKETEETARLIEDLTKERDALLDENEILKDYIAKLEKATSAPAPAPPEPKYLQTCCSKKQKDCRHLTRNNAAEGFCRMLKKEVNLKKPYKDCEYFRSPLPL